jgi:chaperone required for assembly of F1-ATPase
VRPDGSTIRFYNEAGVAPDEVRGSGYHFVTLDHRFLVTPTNSRFSVPSAAAATVIAAEFERQQSKVYPFTMPIVIFPLLCLTKQFSLAFGAHSMRDDKASKAGVISSLIHRFKFDQLWLSFVAKESLTCCPVCEATTATN